MRIQVWLPKIQAAEYKLPEQCPYEGCSGDMFKLHGGKGETQAVRDRPPDAKQILAILYDCYKAAPAP